MSDNYIMHYGVKGMHWGVIRYRSGYVRPITGHKRIGLRQWNMDRRLDHAIRKSENAGFRNESLVAKRATIDMKKLKNQAYHETADGSGVSVVLNPKKASKLNRKAAKLNVKIAKNDKEKARMDRLAAQIATDKKLADIPPATITQGEGVYSKYSAVRLGNKVFIGTERKVNRKTRAYDARHLIYTAVGNKLALKKKG